MEQRIVILREASSAAEDEDDIYHELKAIVELREKAYARAKSLSTKRAAIAADEKFFQAVEVTPWPSELIEDLRV